MAGVAVVLTDSEGRVLLIRRGDTGEWALPGGTLEWGESVRDCARRELREEAGVTEFSIARLVGVFSRPDRDPRFHAVTTVVAGSLKGAATGALNPIEILDVKLFEPANRPRLGMGMDDMLVAALGSEAASVE